MLKTLHLVGKMSLKPLKTSYERLVLYLTSLQDRYEVESGINTPERSYHIVWWRMVVILRDALPESFEIRVDLL